MKAENGKSMAKWDGVAARNWPLVLPCRGLHEAQVLRRARAGQLFCMEQHPSRPNCALNDLAMCSWAVLLLFTMMLSSPRRMISHSQYAT